MEKTMGYRADVGGARFVPSEQVILENKRKFEIFWWSLNYKKARKTPSDSILEWTKQYKEADQKTNVFFMSYVFPDHSKNYYPKEIKPFIEKTVQFWHEEKTIDVLKATKQVKVGPLYNLVIETLLIDSLENNPRRAVDVATKLLACDEEAAYQFLDRNFINRPTPRKENVFV
jgi:hypothetical protein